MQGFLTFLGGNTEPKLTNKTYIHEYGGIILTSIPAFVCLFFWY